jgi:hypothetical protein
MLEKTSNLNEQFQQHQRKIDYDIKEDAKAEAKE